MQKMDPILQYGPNDYSGGKALGIFVAIAGVFIASWLLGAALKLINSKGTQLKSNEKLKQDESKQ